MSIDVKVPLLPESVSDAVVSLWLKKPGDKIAEGDVLCELETDKVMLEVPAIEAGVLQTVFCSEGEKVVADQVLAQIEQGADVVASSSDNSATDTQSIAAATVEPPISPSVRKSLHTHELDASQVPGSGKHGRIIKEDIDDVIASKSTVSSDLASEAIAVDDVRRVAMTRMRLKISERLLASQQQTASLTTFNEIDMTQIIALRAKYKDVFMKKHGVKLGFMSFFVKACTQALQAFPEVNAFIDNEDIVYNRHAHIGIAVSTEKGLVVPVIRKADTLSMHTIEQSILDYAKKANNAKLTLEDMSGGTFTITNGGVFGSMLSTPILNMPQSAILGMHNIVNRPMVVDGDIVIRPMMYVALTYDHRIIDGSQSVRFLVMVKQLLEEPPRVLLDI